MRKNWTVAAPHHPLSPPIDRPDTLFHGEPRHDPFTLGNHHSRIVTNRYRIVTNRHHSW
jgi:hypothetical protein